MDRRIRKRGGERITFKLTFNFEEISSHAKCSSPDMVRARYVCCSVSFKQLWFCFARLCTHARTLAAAIAVAAQNVLDDAPSKP